MIFIVNFINLLTSILTFAIFGRVLMSWINPRGDNLVSNLLFNLHQFESQTIESQIQSHTHLSSNHQLILQSIWI